MIILYNVVGNAVACSKPSVLDLQWQHSIFYWR